ncbi:MAG: triose-phosphate isomerase [Candidatus Diapherotrites archaeon]|nr:triose-phosphate isomerase [Candidatus Diapherotrites archaeon]
MDLPAVVINFKAYAQAMGARAVDIARAAERVHDETGVSVVVAPNAVDLVRVREAVDIPVFAQHVDAYQPGAHTGSVLLEMLAEWGIDGTIINHSEHQVNFSWVEYVVHRAHELHLEVIACAADDAIARAVSDLQPNAVAVEPPELIGTDISVSKAKPEIIRRSVELVHAPVLVGAGVKTTEDVKKAVELGAQGVLVASGVTKAKDPYKAIMELAEGIIRALP